MRALGLLIAAGTVAVGCAHAPKTAAQRSEVDQRAIDALTQMEAKDPGLRPLLDQSAGYIVFPTIGQGGLVVGGASGRGVAFERGQVVGYVDLTQGSFGAQIGGQSFAELIIARDPAAWQKMRSGSFEFGGHASATVVRTGAAAEGQFTNGVAVFVQPRGGAMLNASLTGQRLKFL